MPRRKSQPFKKSLRNPKTWLKYDIPSVSIDRKTWDSLCKSVKVKLIELLRERKHKVDCYMLIHRLQQIANIDRKSDRERNNLSSKKSRCSNIIKRINNDIEKLISYNES
jgi:hypothetical protein